MPTRLQQIRESRGLTREGLAAKADISREYVRLLETAHAPTPSLRIARALALALGLSVDELWPPDPPAAAMVAPAKARLRKVAA